ncbi:phosphotransferase [Hassallia byssoidea VB512170]|uniref:Phosphotransferase n=1 Tax=Hassallia byssoidea VB512170 TaxID=1304833 RepID=A0A846HB71_9CYAN|nr:phosphotransferase [Hassalia byssoidea]NEU74847.1 phosphotransferase [Hassalia byssoidea VB512170]
MKIISPYGKDVLDELQRVYHLNSVEDLVTTIHDHLAKHYFIESCEILSVHVAFGLTLNILASGNIYYLKFASRTMNRTPKDLFLYIDFLYRNAIPVPKIFKTTDGSWFKSVLNDTDYDVVYLMSSSPGEPILAPSPSRIQEYAAVMARYHKLGLNYEPKVLGGQPTTFTIEQAIASDLPKFYHALCGREKLFSAREIDLINFIINYICTTFALAQPLQLLRTHIHGDFRLCHVFYTGETVSGIIDIDQSTYAERLIDVCYGLISSPNPAGGIFFSIEQIQLFLSSYNQEFPFTASERKLLKPMLLYALIEQLDEVSKCYETGNSDTTITDIELTHKALAKIFDIQEAKLIST